MERQRPGTPSLLRAINDRAALEALLAGGSLTRPQIGALTGLSKPTASQLLARLQASGLVVLDGIQEGGIGRAAVRYRINPEAGYAAGLDVTPARLMAAVANLTGSVLGEHTVTTPGRAGGDVVDRVRQAVHGAAHAAGLDPAAVRRVVIGAPGGINPATGRLQYAQHLPGWHLPNLLGRLSDGVGVPVTFENDVNLTAIAERTHGSAQGCRDFVQLWISDGVGLAIVLGGTLHRGATGGAGEVGYLPMPGRPVARGPRATRYDGLQELAGGPELAKVLRAHGIRGGDAATLVAAATALVAGEPGSARGRRAAAGLREIALRVATGIAAVVSIIDPELVVLSGEPMLAGGETLRALIEREYAAMPMLPRPRLRLSTAGPHPILAGALQIALTGLREQLFGDTVSL